MIPWRIPYKMSFLWHQPLYSWTSGVETFTPFNSRSPKLSSVLSTAHLVFRVYSPIRNSCASASVTASSHVTEQWFKRIFKLIICLCLTRKFLAESFDEASKPKVSAPTFFLRIPCCPIRESLSLSNLDTLTSSNISSQLFDHLIHIF